MNQRPPGPVGYVGLVTRAVALIIDALAINLVAVLVGGVTTLIASLFGWGSGLNSAEAVAGAVLWWLWISAYFVLFWSLTGQTPGGRLLGFRVVNVNGGRIPARQALRRFGGTVLAALPLGAGFLWSCSTIAAGACTTGSGEPWCAGIPVSCTTPLGRRSSRSSCWTAGSISRLSTPAIRW